MPEALTGMWYLSIPEEDSSSSSDRNELYEILDGAIREWMYQENSPIRDQIIKARHASGDAATTDELDDPWLNPEELDPVGQALYRRIVGIFDALIEENSEVRVTLEPVFSQ